MLNEKPRQIDIHRRIYQFVLRVINLTKQLNRTSQNSVFVKQITRSASSIGANSTEAEAASTKKEFTRCFTIAKKEAKETLYWLRLIADTNDPLKSRMEQLIQENDELVRIISSIILKSKDYDPSKKFSI